MENLNSTRRSIGQVIFRHTPGSLISIEEWGVYGRVAAIKGSPDTDVDKNILCKKVRWFVSKWKEESEGKVRGYDVDVMEPDSLVAIRPEGKVLWDFIPKMLLECTNSQCKIIVSSDDSSFSGQCPRCQSKLKQFRYVWFHNCGILLPFLPITQVNCPKHGRKYLYLNDTGRFRSSTWRCRECTYERGLGMLPCIDEVCRKNRQGKGDYLRGSVWNDPWVYFTQVVTFVNLKDSQIRPVIESSLKEELLLSAYTGSIKAGENNLTIKAVNDGIEKVNCVKCGKAIPVTAKFCSECGTPQPLAANINQENKKQLLPDSLITEDSELATFAILRDLQRTLSLKDEKRRHEEDKNVEKAQSLLASQESFARIGVNDVLMINDFPLTYAAVGYTRFQSKPPNWLRAFPPLNSSDTKIPIYTNCITTEAWMIQLSAHYILEWLETNGLLNDLTQKPNVKGMDESDSKIWLISFLANESEDKKTLQLQHTIHELIHSLSHIFLQSLAIESGLDIASFGELLLPNVLSFIIYAGESDVGGLSASFNQGLSQIVDSVSEQMRSCKFDPSCSEDDDGACVGCLHLPRGCVEFNEKLSRAYAFGGKTKSLNVKDILVGFLDLKNK